MYQNFDIHVLQISCNTFIVYIHVHVHVFIYLLYYTLFVGVWGYIQGTRDMVRDLEKRVKLAKCNVETINSILAKLCQKPLYQRKDDKKDCLLNLEVHVHAHTTGTIHCRLVVHVHTKFCKL